MHLGPPLSSDLCGENKALFAHKGLSPEFHADQARGEKQDPKTTTKSAADVSLLRIYLTFFFELYVGPRLCWMEQTPANRNWEQVRKKET